MWVGNGRGLVGAYTLLSREVLVKELLVSLPREYTEGEWLKQLLRRVVGKGKRKQWRTFVALAKQL